MKVMFFYPNVNNAMYAKPYHFGLACMSSVLKENGHKTSMVYMETLNPDHLIEAVKREKPDIIGYTSISSQIPHVKEAAKIVKEHFDIYSIVGGVHPTIAPDCIKDLEVDALARGEGEYSLLKLVEALESGKDHTKIDGIWFKENNTVIKNPIRPLIKDLDSMPFPDRELTDHQAMIDRYAGVAFFMFSRGCPFQCTYCSNHAIAKLYTTGNYMRQRSPEKSIEEIKVVQAKYNFSTISLSDDTLNINRKWLDEFLEKYKKEINLPFMCNLRADLCSRDMFKKLKGAGCTEVLMGIESGNEYIRNEIMKRPMTNQQIRDAFMWAREFGIKTLGNSMLGLPYETEETIKDTIRLNTEVDPTLIGVGIFYPYEGTQLEVLCKQEGFIKHGRTEFKEREYSILEQPTISSKRVRWYYENFHYLVYRYTNPKKALYYKLYSYKTVVSIINLLKRNVPMETRRKIKKMLGDVNW